MKSKLSRMLWVGKLLHKKNLFSRIAFIAIIALMLGGCLAEDVDNTSPQVAYMRVRVVAAYPHDPSAFTQGILVHNGQFYESAGIYGKSSLRQVEIATGTVLNQTPVPQQYFAEGLALVGNRLIQITWKEGTALVYDVNTLQQIDAFNYEGEGWGLCYDGQVLFMSDGSSNLFVRNADSFDLVKTIPVTLLGDPMINLNELECVGNYVYANVWFSNVILKIDKQTGLVVGYIDVLNLLTPEEQATLSQGAVLNGIAYNPDKDTFYITGKLWPKVFEVKLDGQ